LAIRQVILPHLFDANVWFREDETLLIGDDGLVVEATSWGSRVWATVRTAPAPLLVTMSAFVLLLFASMVCLVAGAAEPGDLVFGAFGATGVGLGLVLVSNVNGSAVGMERFADAVRSGPLKFSGTRWTARRYRLLGAVYVVMGCVFAAVGWSSAIK
jgi:hypothetical protein